MQIMNQITPLVYQDILSKLPYEIAVYIIGFLDMPSLIQTSQVSRGWNALCNEPCLWRELFEAQKWEYDKKGMMSYLSPDEGISSIPIVRSSSPLIESDKRTKLYNMKNALRSTPPQQPSLSPNETVATSSRPISRGSTQPLSPTQPSLSRPVSPRVSGLKTDEMMYHYSEESGTRYINWKRLYRNRYLIEERWKRGSCKMRLFPPNSCPAVELHSEGIYTLQFDKNKIVTGSRDETIKIWDYHSGRCTKTIHCHNGSVLCLQYNEKYIVSGSSDATVVVSDIETGETVAKLLGHLDSVLSLKMVDDKIVSCSKDRTLRIWDIETKECIRILKGHKTAVNAVQWKGDKIVSASGDRAIKIWNSETGECLNTLEAHIRGVACVEFDGEYIISGSSDQTIKVWNAASGQCIYTLAGHSELVRTIQMDHVSSRIISGCYNGHLKIWDLTEGKLMRDLGQATKGRILNLKFDCSKIICCSTLVRLMICDFAHGIDTKFLLL
ncbi:WD40 repeat-like protein [Backusella circina FSU 941]|nr:WD40 repeat-like protein [Backusella circina FSU 941]